jgi:O-antigen ligase
MALSGCLSQYTDWAGTALEVAAIAIGAVWCLSLRDNECRRPLQKGFIIGFCVLLALLYFDSLMIISGRPMLYPSSAALRGPFFLCNQLARHLVFCIFILMYISNTKHRPARIFFRSLAAAAILPLIFTGSRSSLIGTVGGILIVLTTRSRRRSGKILLAGAVSVALLEILWISQSSYSDFLRQRWGKTAAAAEENSFQAIQFHGSVSAFQSSPLTGVGKGGYARSPFSTKLAGLHHEIHNSYLAALAEGGVLGSLCLAFAIVSAIRRGLRVLRKGPPGSGFVAAGLLMAFIMAVHGTFYRERGFWLCLGYVLASSVLATKRFRRPVWWGTTSENQGRGAPGAVSYTAQPRLEHYRPASGVSSS